MRLKRMPLGITLAFVGLPLVLIVIDAATPKQCASVPPVGTEVVIPGERMTLRSASPDRVVFAVEREPFPTDYRLNPDHGHIHPNQIEGFHVVEGRAQFFVDDKTVVLEPGQTVVVPPNTVHHWMSLDGKPVRVEAYFEPALDIAAWFVHFQAHIAAGSMDLLQAAVISREFSQGSPAPASPGPAVWQFVARTLAPVARVMGYTPC